MSLLFFFLGFIVGSVSGAVIVKHKNTQIQISTADNTTQTQIM